MSGATETAIWDLIRQNQLLTEQQISDLSAKFVGSDDKTIAKKLIESEVLTSWQASRLLAGKAKIKVGNFVLLNRYESSGDANLCLAREVDKTQKLTVRITSISISKQADLAGKLIEAGKRLAKLSSEANKLSEVRDVENRVTYLFSTEVAPLQELTKKKKLSSDEIANILQGVVTGLKGFGDEMSNFGRLSASSVTWNGKAVGLLPGEICDGSELDPPEAKVNGLSVSSYVWYVGKLGSSLLGASSSQDPLNARLVELCQKCVATERPTFEVMATEVSKLTADSAGATKAESTSAPEPAIKIDTGAKPATTAPAPEGELSAVQIAHRFAAERIDLKKNKVKLDRTKTKKPIPVIALIAYSVIGLGLLGATIPVVMYINSTQQSKTVAKADGPKAEEKKAEAKEEPAKKAAPAEADPNPAPLVAIEDPTTPTADANAANNANPATGATPNPNPVTPMPNGLAGTPTPMPPSGGEPKANVDVATPAVAAPMPEVAVSPMPEAPGNPTPTPPMPNPAPMFVPAFKDLAKYASLPEATSVQEVVIGSVHLAPNDLLRMEIKGGGKAYKAKNNFSVDNADGGTSTTAFDIFAVDEGSNKKTPIAKMRVGEDKLHFQWLEAAAKHPAAPSLQNCYVSLRTGTEVSGLALRKPVKLDPFVLDEKKAGGKAEIKLENLPLDTAIKVEILPLGETFPTHSFPGDVKSAGVNKGVVQVNFGGKYSESLCLRVENDLKGKQLVINTGAFFLTQKKPIPYKAEDAKKELDRANAAVAQNQAAIAEADKLPAPQKTALEGQMQRWRADLKEAQEAVKNLTDTMTFIESLKGSQLPLAIYFEADEYRVYLATPSGEPVN